MSNTNDIRAAGSTNSLLSVLAAILLAFGSACDGMGGDEGGKARPAEGNTVTVDVVGEGRVIDAATGQALPPGKHPLHAGSTLKAEPAEHWRFENWSGGLTGNANPVTLTDDPTKPIFALFEPLTELKTDVIGEGTVEPAGGWYAEGQEVTVTAKPAPGWIFRRWRGPVDDMESAQTTMSIGFDAYASAEFQPREGMTDLNLVGDLDAMLVEFGLASERMSPALFAFDTGGHTYQPERLPNGVPDAAELTLLEEILKTPGFNRVPSGGASNETVWDAWRRNLEQARADLKDAKPEHVARLLAAYMTLGSPGHQKTMPTLLHEHGGITVDPDKYDTSCNRYFGDEAEADNDGLWNNEEWQKTLESKGGGPVTMEIIRSYAHEAMTPAISGDVPGPSGGETADR